MAISATWRSGVSGAQVGELHVVDGGDGSSYAQAVAMYPAAVARVVSNVSQVLGVDIAALVGERGK